MRKVLLSAGHYPEAPGACHPAKDKGGFCEHAEAQKWVKVLASILESQCEVEIVPTGKLGSKVSWINAQPDTDVVLEIHFNACGGCPAKGSESLYFPGSTRGKKIAQMVQRELSKVFPPNRGAKEGWYGMDRPGVKDYPGDVEGDETPDYLLRKTKAVACIVEPEFIHNQKTIEQNREEGCIAIAAAVLGYFGYYNVG